MNEWKDQLKDGKVMGKSLGIESHTKIVNI